MNLDWSDSDLMFGLFLGGIFASTFLGRFARKLFVEWGSDD